MTDFPQDGSTIGPYRVGRRLGVGAMGTVFEAHDSTLHRRVALKVISPPLADDPAWRARFTREAQAQASLDSPHVVTVHAHGEADGRLYLATQLVPGGDLAARLVRLGAPPTRVALDLVAQVASGLADAHAAGLVHRDIKPANVLLRQRDDGFHAYLADFGIARDLGGDATRTGGGTLGTPSYMAPELHTGSPAGPASDIYSLGCLLWATLSGRAPYAGTSDFQVVTAHLEDPVPQLDAALPQATGINEVLRRSMAKDPADRYSSAVEMRTALRRLAGAPDRSPPPPPVVPAPALTPVLPAGSAGTPTGRTGTSPRRRAVTAALAGLALVLVVGLGAAYLLGQRTPQTTPTPDAPVPGRPTPDLGTTAAPTPAPGGGYEVQAGDEPRAVASMAGALVTGVGVSRAQGECAAQETITQVGLARLVDIGFFTPALQFADLELAPYPDVKAALASATLTCLAG